MARCGKLNSKRKGGKRKVMRHDQWLCDSLHLPQWMAKFHSSYEMTEKDYQDVQQYAKNIE